LSGTEDRLRIVAVLNRDGGTLKTTDLDQLCERAAAIFAERGHELECRAVEGGAVDATLKEVVATPGVDAVIAGGGDGTISSAAAIAYASGLPLGVLPAGTMNLFARSLRVPLDLDEALVALADAEIDTADIAVANGRAFVHQFSVGIHARLVRIREESMSYGSRTGKMLASLRAIAATALDPPRFEAELQTSRGSERRQVSGISVSNNPLGEGQIFADRLDRGVLGVYVALPMNTSALLKLAMDLFTGSWRQSPLVEEREVAEVTLSFPKRRRGNQAVLDGELIDLDRSVRITLHPGALKVLRPRAA
jgi:diacylglycerol kinase family enzyme